VKFIQDKPHYNHHTDDPAELYFRSSADRAPTHLKCVGLGYCLSAESSKEFNLELAPFEFMGAGVFGEGRPCSWSSSIKWTGSSHKYGIYKHRDSVLIIESHGGGEQGYYDSDCHALELLENMCRTLSPERIWDVCYLIAKTENGAYRKGRQEMAALFLEGRLKRRRRNSSYRLEIVEQRNG
jgi:hypothetical protein